jgi:regulator of protease activity HflC (stomatin/prohibitin superfamily)
MNDYVSWFVGLVIGFWLVPAFLAIAQGLSLFVIVHECECVVYELFGKVRLVLQEPGLHSPWKALGPLAALVPLFGKKLTVDLRLDQSYLRSLPVNSEEGAPMGVGVWCEMKVSDPVAYLYKNTDPAGSLRANISNATVRCLSNMKLVDLLEERHSMSRTVRQEVTTQSQDWGYQVGSVYVRKVHFRDTGMISQIEQKVVNRLRQVTAAIQQEGKNRVNVIHSAAEREAAVEFAKAAATRPLIVGQALAQVAKNPGIAQALFEVLETQNALESPQLEVSVLPSGASVLYTLGGTGRSGAGSSSSDGSLRRQKTVRSVG